MGDVSDIIKNVLDNTKIKGMELAATLEDSRFSTITDWISTGSYALNKVISGSYYRGVPSGRVICLASPSGCGKSFTIANCVREAQKKGYLCIVCDSENAFDADFLKNIGGSPAEVLHMPVITVSDVKIKLTKLLREIKAAHPDQKIFVAIDSITGLATDKQIYADIEADKNAADMGLFARELRGLAKILTHTAAQFDIPMVCSNHIWEQPAQNPKAAPIKKMNGGEGFVYASSAIIYFTKRLERDENDKKKINGLFLNATTEKNRFVPQGAKASIYVSFEQGVNKWYGMLDDALEHGLVKKAGAWFKFFNLEGEEVGKVQGEKKIYKKEVWKPILDGLNEKVEATFKFNEYIDEDIDDELDAELGEETTETS